MQSINAKADSLKKQIQQPWGLAPKPPPDGTTASPTDHPSQPGGSGLSRLGGDGMFCVSLGWFGLLGYRWRGSKGWGAGLRQFLGKLGKRSPLATDRLQTSPASPHNNARKSNVAYRTHLKQ